MPIEMHQIHLKPADFFSKNPAVDVPSTKNQASILYKKKGGLVSGFVAEVPQTHDTDHRKAKLIVEDNGIEIVVQQSQQGIKACCM